MTIKFLNIFSVFLRSLLGVKIHPITSSKKKLGSQKKKKKIKGGGGGRDMCREAARFLIFKKYFYTPSFSLWETFISKILPHKKPKKNTEYINKYI